MPARSRPWLLVLAGWQLFVWGTRIRNVLGDDELMGLDKVLLVGLSATFLAYGLTALWVWRVLRRGEPAPVAGVRWLQVGAGWTVLVWLVRGFDIATSGHDVGFVVVHLVLAVVSVALALQVVRLLAKAPDAEPPDGPADQHEAAVSPPAPSGS